AKRLSAPRPAVGLPAPVKARRIRPMTPKPSAPLILVVDDSPDAAECLALVLEQEGFRVDVAHDGRSALARIASDPPDAVLLDLGLPDLDGIVVAQRIRARQDAAAGVLLVAISGHGADSDLEATRAAGFDAHLVKPVAPERILDLLAGRQLIPGPR